MSATLAGQTRATPVLGEGGEVYALLTNGTLSVLDANLIKLWSANGLGSNNLIASPNLDCNRRSATLMQSGPGVLYTASPSGHLVDSPKLSTTAEWPKWQHDAQNSGNPDFPRNAGCP